MEKGNQEIVRQEGHVSFIRNMRMLYSGEERGILKESDISSDVVPICDSRISYKTPLKSRITQEDTLSCFGEELVLPRSKNMNKTDITKDTRRKAEDRLIRKNDRMRDLIM